MGNKDGGIGRTDRVARSLSEWIELAAKYSGEEWSQRRKRTQVALEQYLADRALALELMHDAHFALLDHNLVKLNGKLIELERLFG